MKNIFVRNALVVIGALIGGVLHASGPFDFIAMGGNVVSNTDVRVLDNVTEEANNQNNNHGNRVNSVAWQPCGVHLAMGGNGGNPQVRVYKFDGQAQSLTEVTTRPNGADVNSVSWSPDGCFLATGGDTPQRDNNQVRVYAFTGTELQLRASFNHGQSIRAVAWAPDGSRIAIGGLGPSGNPVNQIRVLEFTGNALNLLVSAPQGGAVNAIDWNPDATRLVIGGDFNQARVLSPATLATLASFNHGQKVNAVAWHSNGTHIAIGGFGGGSPFEQVRILNYNGTNTLTRTDGRNNGGGVNGLSWRCDGNKLALGSDPTIPGGFGVRSHSFNSGTGQLGGSSNFVHGSNVWSVDYLPCCSPGNICDGECGEVIHQGPTCFTGNVAVQKNLTVFGCISAVECLTPSDGSIKKDVVPISPADSLAAITSLTPVTYAYNDEWQAEHGMHDAQRGFIAQEVQSVLPELVHESGGIAQLDYAKLVVDLVGAVQALQAEVELLK